MVLIALPLFDKKSLLISGWLFDHYIIFSWIEEGIVKRYELTIKLLAKFCKYLIASIAKYHPLSLLNIIQSNNDQRITES